MTLLSPSKQLDPPAHRPHRNSRILSCTAASHVQPQARGTTGTLVREGSRSEDSLSNAEWRLGAPRPVAVPPPRTRLCC